MGLSANHGRRKGTQREEAKRKEERDKEPEGKEEKDKEEKDKEKRGKRLRIHKKFRGKGFGKKIFKWAIKRSIDKRAHLVQLTTDKQRPDAIEFYKALGFRDSHMGMKLHL